MNIVFWFLVILALVAFWFAACSLYKPIGDFLLEIFADSKDGMEDSDQNIEDEEENKNEKG